MIKDLHTQEVIEAIEAMMTEAQKEARRAYKRKWNREHPENVRLSQEKFWAKKAAENGKEGMPSEQERITK